MCCENNPVKPKEKESFRVNKCDRCVTSRNRCKDCRDNPSYAYVPLQSLYKEYIPTCPRGHDDCVCDPAYIKYRDPEWYKELYGDKTVYEAAQECRDTDPDEDCYDNEDK